MADEEEVEQPDGELDARGDAEDPRNDSPHRSDTVDTSALLDSTSPAVSPDGTATSATSGAPAHNGAKRPHQPLGAPPRSLLAKAKKKAKTSCRPATGGVPATGGKVKAEEVTPSPEADYGQAPTSPHEGLPERPAPARPAPAPLRLRCKRPPNSDIEKSLDELTVKTPRRRRLFQRAIGWQPDNDDGSHWPSEAWQDVHTNTWWQHEEASIHPASPFPQAWPKTSAPVAPSRQLQAAPTSESLAQRSRPPQAAPRLPQAAPALPQAAHDGPKGSLHGSIGQVQGPNEESRGAPSGTIHRTAARGAPSANASRDRTAPSSRGASLGSGALHRTDLPSRGAPSGSGSLHWTEPSRGWPSGSSGGYKTLPYTLAQCKRKFIVQLWETPNRRLVNEQMEEVDTLGRPLRFRGAPGRGRGTHGKGNDGPPVEVEGEGNDKGKGKAEPKARARTKGRGKGKDGKGKGVKGKWVSWRRR